MNPDTNGQVVPTLDHVLGQQRAVAILRTAIYAYFHDRTKATEEQAFPHLLMTGPAGVGKTLLSETVAREVACNIHTELAQNLKTPEQIHGALMMLEPGDILFVDEIHELPSAAQVTLYRALEERRLFLGKRHVVTLPSFCLIGATTDESFLRRSMRERFRIHIRLTHYSDEEMFLLIRQRAKRLGWNDSSGAAKPLTGCNGISSGSDASSGRPANEVSLKHFDALPWQTNATGHYRFVDLPFGKYRITETQPAGVAEGKAIVGTKGGTVDGTNSVKDIILDNADGRYRDGYDFTEIQAAGGTGSALTAAEAQEMVAFHNQARAEVANPNGNPPVLPLPPLTWSNEIAAFAQAWANKLALTGQIAHRPPDGPDAQKYGENIAFNPTLMGGAQAWYNEKAFYVYPNPIDVDFAKVGHYTQMVSRRSTLIGVGKAVITTGPFQGMLVIVANYDLPGNVTGQPPY